MNYRRLSVIIGLCAVLGGSLVLAASGPRGIADIPFGFRVQDRDLPAGTYMVEEMSAPNVLHLRNEDTGASLVVLAPTRKMGAPGDAKLIFNRYGDRYFLSQVWFDGDENGRAISQGHLEKELAVTGKTPGIVAMIRFK